MDFRDVVYRRKHIVDEYSSIFYCFLIKGKIEGFARFICCLSGDKCHFVEYEGAFNNNEPNGVCNMLYYELSNIPNILEDDSEYNFDKTKIFEGFYEDFEFGDNKYLLNKAKRYSLFDKNVLEFQDKLGNFTTQGKGIVYNKNGKLVVESKKLNNIGNNKVEHVEVNLFCVDNKIKGSIQACLSLNAIDKSKKRNSLFTNNS